MLAVSITRTCGGDPMIAEDGGIVLQVLPAHAGVILIHFVIRLKRYRITRTCGGDPVLFQSDIKQKLSITRTCGGDPDI